MSVTVTVDTAKLDQIIAALPKEKIVRFVADGVEYGLYQEMGTSRMSARPFMSPAVEAVRGGFNQAFNGIDSLMQAEAVVDKTAFDIEAGAKINAPVDTGALRSSIHVTPDRP